MLRVLVTLVVVTTGTNEFGALMQSREHALIQGPPKDRGAMQFPEDDPFRHAIPVLTQMAAERNLTTEHFQILDLILGQVTSLNEQSLIQHNSDKSSLDDSINEIKQCNTNFINSDLGQWETTTSQNSNDHSSCREGQVTLHDASNLNCGKYETWVANSPREFSCTTDLQDFPAHFPDNTGVSEPWYSAMPSCKKQMALWGQDFANGETLQSTCTTAFGLFSAKVTTCHQSQKKLESSACEHHAVSKEVCRTLDFCHASEVADHGRRCAQVASNVRSRKTATHSGDMIKCFVDVLKADGHDLSGCYAPAVNESRWNITCPEVPAKSVCSIGSAPGTSQYELEHYSNKDWWTKVSNEVRSSPFKEMKEDIETCASPAVVCSRFACPDGFVDKLNPVESCNETGVCSKEQCCDVEAVCEDLTCNAGYTKTSTGGCGAAECENANCCEAKGSCADFSCPDKHIKTELGLCAGVTCNQTECCSVEAQCSDWNCGNDHVKSNSDGCNATVCTNEICCDQKAICANHVCSGAWEKNPSVPDSHVCDAAKCDNAICCRTTTTTTTTAFVMVENNLCISSAHVAPKRFPISKPIRKLRIDRVGGSGVQCNGAATASYWGCGDDPNKIGVYVLKANGDVMPPTSKSGWDGTPTGVNINSGSLQFDWILPRSNLSIGYGDAAVGSTADNSGETCVNIFALYQ